MAPLRKQTTGTYLTSARRQLFDVGFDPNQFNMTGIVPLPTLDDDDNCFQPIESVCHDDSVHFEPDESDYNSDCSLGSLNYLYLNIERNSRFKRLFLNQNSDINKTSRISENIVTKTQVSRKKSLKILSAKSINKLNTISFYGKQKSITRNLYSRQSYVSQLKNKHTRPKIRKTTYLVRKFKPYFNKLSSSLMNRKQRQNLKINNLIRNRLKEPMPLMQCNPKVRKNIQQNSEEFSLTNSIEKSSRQNEIDFLTQCENILMKETHSLEYIKKEPESTPFLLHEYSDTDDFENTDFVNGIIDRLNDEDNTFTDSDNNGQWDINEHADVCEGNVTYTAL